MFLHASLLVLKTCSDILGQKQSSSCNVRLAYPILPPTAASNGSGGTLLFRYFKKQHVVDTHIVCQKTQTKYSKGDSSANVVLKISLQESTRNMLVIQISGWYVLKTLVELKIIMYKFFGCHFWYRIGILYPKQCNHVQ